MIIFSTCCLLHVSCACLSRAVRLTGATRPDGTTRSDAGRLEVQDNDGTWKTVKGSPSAAVADVACRQLGFARSLLYPPDTFYPQESGAQLTAINCVGTEASLSDCPRGASPSSEGEVSLQCYVNGTYSAGYWKYIPMPGPWTASPLAATHTPRRSCCRFLANLLR
jgi:hypothetical protein